MSNYTKATNFLAKDSLASGDPLKVVRGSEIDAEFEAIETAVASKANSADVYTKAEVDAIEVAVSGPFSVLTAYDPSTAQGSLIKLSAGTTLNTGLAAGTHFLIYNTTGASITITQGSGLTLRLNGTTVTGNRSVLRYGIAVVTVISTTEYVIGGAVV